MTGVETVGEAAGRLNPGGGGGWPFVYCMAYPACTGGVGA